MKHFIAYGILFLGFSMLILTELWRYNNPETFIVKTLTVKVDSLQQVVLLKDSLVTPIIYTKVSGFEKLPFPQAKAKFISTILPAVLVAKHQIENKRNKLLRLHKRKQWSEADSAFFADIKGRYNAKDIEDLVHRMGTLPNSIVLAQAAIETGWGQSRFFVEASNVFGIWSVNVNESRIAAGKTRENKTIYVRSYPDMSLSIIDYFEVLSRANVYRSLRKARQETTDPFKLIPHLKYYSERRSFYINLLSRVIADNKLTQYDSYRIDPKYFVEE